MANQAIDQMARRAPRRDSSPTACSSEELGFHYVGPVDGHDLPGLVNWLEQVKDHPGPVLLHVLTVKGQGVPQASDDPVTYHTPPVFEKVGPNRSIVSLKRGGSRAYTDAVSTALYDALRDDPRVAVLTAAMCQGNKLEKVRSDFPDRFFDVGICESHAVAFAAGMAKAGMRPVVDIYSTFLQRSFDQIFQEVSLQNLPVTFCLDRAGLTGPDGPTHHGTYDIPYMRLFPNMVVMAPGDEFDVVPMLNFALAHTSPTSIRYPKASLEAIERTPTPIELGTAEVLEWGTDVVFVAFGTLLSTCVKAAEQLRAEGLDVGVVNARFAKPLDRNVILRAIEEGALVVTVEEGTLEGGFGSAVLEAANAAHLDARNVIRLGLPDRFVEHGERAELLAELGLDVAGMVKAVRDGMERKVERDGWALERPGHRRARHCRTHSKPDSAESRARARGPPARSKICCILAAGSRTPAHRLKCDPVAAIRGHFESHPGRTSRRRDIRR